MSAPLMHGRLAVAVGAVLVALVVAGCGGGGPMPVRKVLVDVEPAAQGVDREQVRAIVDDVLKKARGIKLVDAAKDGAVLRVRVEGYGTPKAAPADPNAVGAPATTDGATLALSVEVNGVPGEQGGYRGQALVSSKGVAVETRMLVEQALRDALAQVLMTRGAADLDSKTLIGWLEDDGASDEQKKRAVRILGSRRERSAVEALSKVLTAGDVELQPLALAALTNIGDPGAVDAVIAYSDRQPPVVKKQCIEAVRTMGSPRGKAWLFTLSTGHPDAEVQAQAAAALASLEAQGEEPSGAAVAETASAAPKNEATR